MTSYLRLLIAAQVAAAGIALAAAIGVFPIRPEIGGLAGILFWIFVTLIASALPIALPAGITVSVRSAPLGTAPSAIMRRLPVQQRLPGFCMSSACA